YVSSNGGIHDYRFLKKLTEDHEVLFLFYASGEIIPEIDKLPHLQIICKKPAFRSMPLLSEIWHFKRAVKEFQPDIIHTGYVWQTGILAALAGFHPHLSMPWGSDILVEPDKSFVVKRIVNKVMKTCDHVQCDAEFVKQKIVNDYGLKPDMITVFPWGIDLSMFKMNDRVGARKELNINPEKFVIIFNRHLEPIYGVNYLLEAYKNFSAGKEDVLLLMISDGSQKVSVLKFISDNELEQKVTILGRVPNCELPALLSAADVYCSPSLSDGTSLSLLEAMACGLGLVVTDVPAIMEWVNKDNGLMVRKEDPEGLRTAFEKYYKDRTLVQTHGCKNIEIAHQRADWDKNYIKLKHIYGLLLNQKGVQ
ncbi:MAG: glycosyltransferase, partial [Ignavibacteria bacterium]|nr:glycosyltransferase [Ignavibacteria bacterium]